MSEDSTEWMMVLSLSSNCSALGVVLTLDLAKERASVCSDERDLLSVG